MSAEATRRPLAKLGRKRNPALDSAILDAALNVLTENGFAGMTMDVTAKRANATVYRRWPSKIELVIDASHRQTPAAFAATCWP